MREVGRAPFFIIGLPRSGTTLLSVMLANHPEVCLGASSVGMALVRAYRRFLHRLQRGKKSPEEVFRSVLQESYKKRLLPLFGGEKWLADRELFPDFLERQLRVFAERQGKSLWGDKTPDLNFHLAEIDQMLPSARFIHLVRDPRSNALSLHRRQHYDLALAAQRWREINGLAEAQAVLYGGDRFLSVKYEDLLLDTERVMRRVCAFLGLAFDESVLKPGKEEEFLAGKAYVKAELQKEKVFSWKEHLSRREVLKIERIVGRFMLKAGYKPLCWRPDQGEKPLSAWQLFWLKERLMWRMLFRGRREQMIDRRLVLRYVPFSMRIRNFVFGHAKAVFSDGFLRLFGYRD